MNVIARAGLEPAVFGYLSQDGLVTSPVPEGWVWEKPFLTSSEPMSPMPWPMTRLPRYV